MSHYPVRLKQIDNAELSGYITGVTTNLFNSSLQTYIAQTGYFGGHVVYTTGNQVISGIKSFTSGAFGPLATGTGQYIPLSQLTSFSGFITQNFYPSTGNPSGYVTGAVQALTASGSAQRSAVIDLLGVSGISILNSGQSFIFANDGVIGVKVTGSNALTNIINLTGISGVNVILSGNTISIAGDSSIPLVTGIGVTGSTLLTGAVLFTGTSGISTILSGNTVIISGSNGWQVTGSAIKNSVVNFTGTAGITATLSGNTVIMSGQKNDTKSRFYNVFGNSSSNGDFNVVGGGTNGTTRLDFYAPSDFQSLVSLQAVGICSAGAAATARNIDLTSDYGAIGETSTNHSESNTTITYDLSAASSRITGLDISSVFTSLAAEDFCGVLMTHNTIGGNFDYIGILLKYT